jgi:hypothetical protein
VHLANRLYVEPRHEASRYTTAGAGPTIPLAPVSPQTNTHMDDCGGRTTAPLVRRRQNQTPTCTHQATTFIHPRNNTTTFHDVGNFSLDARHAALLTLGLDYSPIRQWKIGGDLRYTSSQFLTGDESNQEPPLPGFTVVNFHSSYAFTNALQLFARVDNALKQDLLHLRLHPIGWSAAEFQPDEPPDL